MRRNLALTIALGAALAVGIAAISTATDYAAVCLRSMATASSSCPPRLIVNFGGGVVPKELPTHNLAPVAVKLWGKVSTDSGAQPSALREVTIDFDRNGAINVTGLPVCKRSKLEADGIRTARRVCRKSIVGTGLAHAEVESLAQGPIPIPLTLFNGGTRGATTTLLIQSAITAATPTAIITTVKVRKVHGGPYGLQAISTIPPIDDGIGSLLDFSFKIKRLFNYKGAKESYAMAKCVDGLLSANISTAFSDGTIIKGTLVRPCVPKG